MGSTWGDYDQDGDLDLFVANHREDLDLLAGLQEGNLDPADPNVLYRNRGDGSFAVVDLPSSAEDGFTYHGAWVDLDGDGDLDLLQINDFGPQATPNQVLWNQDGNLESGDDRGLGVMVYGMGAGLGDLNADGLPEVLVSSWGEVRLLESAPDGTWFDSARSRGLVLDAGEDRQTAWGGDFGDLDADGDLDLALQFGPLEVPDAFTEDLEEATGLPVVENQPDQVWLQQDDGSFEAVGEAWGVADTGNGRGGLLVDLDGDGWLDWLKRELDGPPRAWRARCGDAHQVTVSLSQEGANPDGVGARVVLEGGGGPGSGQCIPGAQACRRVGRHRCTSGSAISTPSTAWWSPGRTEIRPPTRGSVWTVRWR